MVGVNWEGTAGDIDVHVWWVWVGGLRCGGV